MTFTREDYELAALEPDEQCEECKKLAHTTAEQCKRCIDASMEFTKTVNQFIAIGRQMMWTIYGWKNLGTPTICKWDTSNHIPSCED